MEKIQFDELMQQLRKISNQLDLLTNMVKLSAPKQEPTEEEKKLLKLCNLKHTISDMARITNKTTNNVKVVLSGLRSKGMIKSEKRSGKIVYSRT